MNYITYHPLELTNLGRNRLTKDNLYVYRDILTLEIYIMFSDIIYVEQFKRDFDL